MRNLKNQHNFFETVVTIHRYKLIDQFTADVSGYGEGGVKKSYKKSFLIIFPFNIPENGVEGGVFSTITLQNAFKLPSKHL